MALEPQDTNRPNVDLSDDDLDEIAGAQSEAEFSTQLSHTGPPPETAPPT